MHQRIAYRCTVSPSEALVLDLSDIGVPVSEIETALPDFSSLHGLILSQNHLFSTPQFPEGSRIRNMNLSHNSISELTSLSSFPIIGTLNLGWNDLSLDSLAALRQTVVFDLILNDNVKLAHVSRLEVIRTLPLLWTLNGQFITAKEREHAFRVAHMTGEVDNNHTQTQLMNGTILTISDTMGDHQRLQALALHYDDTVAAVGLFNDMPSIKPFFTPLTDLNDVDTTAAHPAILIDLMANLRPNRRWDMAILFSSILEFPIPYVLQKEAMRLLVKNSLTSDEIQMVVEMPEYAKLALTVHLATAVIEDHAKEKLKDVGGMLWDTTGKLWKEVLLSFQANTAYRSTIASCLLSLLTRCPSFSLHIDHLKPVTASAGVNPSDMIRETSRMQKSRTPLPNPPPSPHGMAGRQSRESRPSPTPPQKHISTKPAPHPLDRRGYKPPDRSPVFQFDFNTYEQERSEAMPGEEVMIKPGVFTVILDNMGQGIVRLGPYPGCGAEKNLFVFMRELRWSEKGYWVKIMPGAMTVVSRTSPVVQQTPHELHIYADVSKMDGGFVVASPLNIRDENLKQSHASFSDLRNVPYYLTTAGERPFTVQPRPMGAVRSRVDTVLKHRIMEELRMADQLLNSHANDTTRSPSPPRVKTAPEHRQTEEDGTFLTGLDIAEGDGGESQQDVPSNATEFGGPESTNFTGEKENFPSPSPKPVDQEFSIVQYEEKLVRPSLPPRKAVLSRWYDVPTGSKFSFIVPQPQQFPFRKQRTRPLTRATLPGGWKQMPFLAAPIDDDNKPMDVHPVPSGLTTARSKSSNFGSTVRGSNQPLSGTPNTSASRGINPSRGLTSSFSVRRSSLATRGDGGIRRPQTSHSGIHLGSHM